MYVQVETSQTQSQSQSWLFFLGLNAPAFSLAMLHIINNPNIYHYVLTTFVSLDLLPRNRLNTALGLLSLLGLLVATVAQPSIGVLSDRTKNQRGTRSPYLVIGSIVALVVLLIMVNSKSWWMLISAVIIVQIALNTVQSPMQAFIPDYVAPSRMGMAASIKTILELVGIITSGIVVWAFLGTNTRPEQAVIFVSILMFISVAIAIRVKPDELPRKAKRLNLSGRYVRRYADVNGGRISARLMYGYQSIGQIMRQRPLQWWLAGRFFFYASFNTIGKFAITYLTDVLGYSGDEARALQGIVLLVTGILILGTTMMAGVLSDRMGRKRLATIGGLMSAAAAFSLAFSPAGLYFAIVMICVAGIGSGIFFSTGWALLTYLVPIRKAAFYIGFMNIATTLGGAFGMLGGYMVDRINDTAATPATGYAVLFLLTGISFGLGAFSINRVKDSYQIDLSG